MTPVKHSAFIQELYGEMGNSGNEARTYLFMQKTVLAIICPIDKTVFICYDLFIVE